MSKAQLVRFNATLVEKESRIKVLEELVNRYENGQRYEGRNVDPSNTSGKMCLPKKANLATKQSVDKAVGRHTIKSKNDGTAKMRTNHNGRGFMNM